MRQPLPQTLLAELFRETASMADRLHEIAQELRKQRDQSKRHLQESYQTLAAARERLAGSPHLGRH